MADEQPAAPTPPPGTIAWHDLTVADAEGIRDFYAAVVGWAPRDHDMGPEAGYVDYDMRIASTGEVVAGVCHARGTNAGVPPAWLLYVHVEDVDASAERCLALGGAVLDGPRDMGGGRFAVIRDPAGAILALWQG